MAMAPMLLALLALAPMVLPKRPSSMPSRFWALMVPALRMSTPMAPIKPALDVVLRTDNS